MTVRRVRKHLPWVALCCAFGAQALAAGSAVPPPAVATQPSGHFHPKGKLPSRYTVEQ
jgi:hypothetical protein